MEIAGSHVSAHVVQSLGGVPSPEAFHAAVETLRRTRTPSNDDDPLRAKLRTLHAWLAKAVREKNVAVPDDTVGVLELYLDAGEATARRVMLVESHTGPAVTGLTFFRGVTRAPRRRSSRALRVVVSYVYS